jgi:cell division cycle protein 37
MKQRQIHEQREQRKHKINHLKAQIDCNNVLLPRIKELTAELTSHPSPLARFNSAVEQLQKNPSKDCPPGNDGTKIEQTYDGMLINLYRQVVEDSKNKVSSSNVPDSERDEKLGEIIKAGMKLHCEKLQETIEKDAKELEVEVNEQKKRITSDDIHDGFSNTVSNYTCFGMLNTLHIITVHAGQSSSYRRTNHKNR